MGMEIMGVESLVLGVINAPALLECCSRRLAVISWVRRGEPAPRCPTDTASSRCRTARLTLNEI